MHDDAHCNKKCTPRGHCCVLELETLLAEVQQARAFRCQVVPRKEGRCSNAITQVSSALACNDSKKTPVPAIASSCIFILQSGNLDFFSTMFIVFTC